MQKLFQETLTLDRLVREQYDLTEEIMMENAASAVVQLVHQWRENTSLKAAENRARSNDKKRLKVIVLCGGGNNGADGYAIARQLQGLYCVTVYEVLPAKTDLAKRQKQRALKLGIKCIDLTRDFLKSTSITWDADIYIDAILGASQKQPLSAQLTTIIAKVNQAPGLKIACDLPTGIDSNPFKADFTVTMGALKLRLYQDLAKDYIGKVIVADLGVSRELYEALGETRAQENQRSGHDSGFLDREDQSSITQTPAFLLEKEDLKLPFRTQHDSHKGSYGFVSVVKGEQAGASILSAKAAMRFGAGITALIGEGEKPMELMQMPEISPKTTAIAVGMGLGQQPFDTALLACYPAVIDADLLGNRAALSYLKDKADCVITPHPKEFSQLLSQLDLGDYSIAEIQQQRFELARAFSKKFQSVLVLKGANTIIAQHGVLYVSTLGTNHLAKGGSGDVLSGMIAALLAQGYSALDAAIHGVLAHSLAASSLSINDYAMTPLDLIEALKTLS